MVNESGQHHADEFGQYPSRAIRGLDPPMDGAAVSITLDGIVERESGVTPGPPPVSVRSLVIGLVVAFLVGAVLLSVLSEFAPPASVSSGVIESQAQGLP